MTNPMLLPSEPLTPIDLKERALYIVQRKVDGIRVLFNEAGIPRTRTSKPIPNATIRRELTETYSLSPWRGLPLDGELIIVHPITREHADYNTTQSIVMSRGRVLTPADQMWMYVIFDYVSTRLPFENRWTALVNAVYPNMAFASGRMRLVDTYRVVGRQDTINICELICDSGAEGAVVRNARATYKCGRCTYKEHIAFKYVRWVRDEARVVDTVEYLINLDTSCQRNENLVPGNKLGALVVEHPKWGRFRIGSGFDESERELLWKERESLIGRWLTFKYRPSHIKDCPAPAIWVGWRNINE